MSHKPINHSDQPIRLFQSDFLEFFTHITPLAVLVIYVPVLVYFLAVSALDARLASPWLVVPGFLGGLFIWTFSEYMLHRFVFHFKARSPWQERATYLFHGIHHVQPQAKTRLVMPPVVSIPLALLFYGLFVLVIGRLAGAPQWIAPLFSGFIAGYLCYDMIHYATHHFRMHRGVWKELKRYHMQHHYKTPDARYGVSSPLWDYVFRTTA